MVKNETVTSRSDYIISKMVEVNLVDTENGFRKVKETLMRIGIGAKNTKTLYQSCHILHKQGRYYICHFKELFSLDGKTASTSLEDIQRRNLIASLLEEWDLVKIINKDKIKEHIGHPRLVRILKFHEKDEWTLESKYGIGIKK